MLTRLDLSTTSCHCSTYKLPALPWIWKNRGKYIYIFVYWLDFSPSSRMVIYAYYVTYFQMATFYDENSLIITFSQCNYSSNSIINSFSWHHFHYENCHWLFCLQRNLSSGGITFTSVWLFIIAKLWHFNHFNPIILLRCSSNACTAMDANK